MLTCKHEHVISKSTARRQVGVLDLGMPSTWHGPAWFPRFTLLSQPLTPTKVHYMGAREKDGVCAKTRVGTAIGAL